MGRERRDTLELHKRYDKHDVYLLDGGHEHASSQWGWCRCGLFFRRGISKEGADPRPWVSITSHKMLKMVNKWKWVIGIERLIADVRYCKRIGMK